MATEEEGAPEGDAPKGTKSKHGLHALLTGKHRDMIIVTSSIAGVVIAFISLRRGSGSATSAAGTGYLGPTSAAQAGLGNAGALAGYDQAATQGLQTLLANQSDQLSSLESAVTNLTGAGSKLPTSTASALTSPDPSGTSFVRTDNGSIYQVEGNGSLLGLTYQQWLPFSQQGAQYQSIGSLPPGAQVSTTAGNLRAKIAGAGATP